MIDLQRELIADVRSEAQVLIELHWREIAHFQDIPLDPDWEFYCSSPALRCYTARENGALIGYAVFGVARNKHYMGSFQAVQDILFIHPDHRGTAGLRLIRFSEQQLRAEGVQAIYHHSKVSHPELGEILKLKGYEAIETVYAKRLDKDKSWAQLSPQ